MHLHLNMTSQAIQARMALAQDLNELRDLLRLHIQQCNATATLLPSNSTNITIFLSLPKLDLQLQRLTLCLLWLYRRGDFIYRLYLFSAAVTTMKILFIWPDLVIGFRHMSQFRRRIEPPAWDVSRFEATQSRFFKRRTHQSSIFLKSFIPALPDLFNYARIANSVPSACDNALQRRHVVFRMIDKVRHVKNRYFLAALTHLYFPNHLNSKHPYYAIDGTTPVRCVVTVTPGILRQQKLMLKPLSLIL